MAVFKTVYEREVRGFSCPDTSSRISPSQHLIHRVGLQRVLDGHHGCVNTVSFNPGGDTLVSGSDDLALILWDWQTGEQRFKFNPGHRNNIFQGRLLPHTCDRTLVSCAADGQVRVTFLQEGGGHPDTRKLGQHSGRAHKLALLPDCPACFFSSGEDGVIKLYDLRAHSNRAICSTTIKDWQSPLNQHQPYSSSSEPLEVNSIHCNPARPWQIAVSGGCPYTYVYDHRFMAMNPERNTDDTAKISVRACPKPFAEVCPQHLRLTRPPAGRVTAPVSGKHVTCAVFSQKGELLVTYNEEHIYLFEPAAVGMSSAGLSKRAGLDRPAPSTHDVDNVTDKPPTSTASIIIDPKQREAARKRRLESPGSSTDDHDFVAMKFTGHRNVNTVKGVNFMGMNDEWVVSGSDCGHVFIWDKATGKLEQLMEGDSDVVNCLEPHPHLPATLATSGIDDTVKIWAPTSEFPQPAGAEAMRVMQANSQHVRRRRRLAITPAMLLRLFGGPPRRRQHTDDDDREDDIARADPSAAGLLRLIIGAAPSEDDEDDGDDDNSNDSDDDSNEDDEDDEQEEGEEGVEDDDNEEEEDDDSEDGIVFDEDIEAAEDEKADEGADSQRTQGHDDQQVQQAVRRPASRPPGRQRPTWL